MHGYTRGKKSRESLPWYTRNVRQHVSDVGLLGSPLILQCPLIRKEVREFGAPVEHGQMGWERCRILGLGEVVHEDAYGSSQERFGT